MKEAVIDSYLERQQELTAVEEYSLQHDFKRFDEGRSRYERLIPKTGPGFGQQYAFEVNLDQCTGCKSCVTACHNENGLEEDETWRSVGLFHGGTSAQPALQHVTAACHHCLEPGCLSGCPVKAYEKDAVTGVVKHLDDQCIGCQYCILKCPYDVPKYNKKKGIVHKCDMCISRLDAAQAPACVQACPNEAIRITLVDTNKVRMNPTAFVSVPDAPDSNVTIPTTRYIAAKKMPWNMASADFYSIRPEHSHMPLVVMLVLTQLSVGAFLAELVLKYAVKDSISALLLPMHLMVALGAGVLALGASVFHLGRPLYAFRAVLGLRTSWLSREILAFGIFSLLAAVFAACYWKNPIGQTVYGALFNMLALGRALDLLAVSVFASGLIGIFCSAMVYRDTHRPFWDNHGTTLKFTLTAAILGFATILLTSVVFSIGQEAMTPAQVMEAFGGRFCLVIGCATTLKLFLETFIIFRLNDRGMTLFKKTAILMTRELKPWTAWRYICGVFGGIFLPFFLGSLNKYSDTVFVLTITVPIFLLALAGEFLERLLFFRSVVPLSMSTEKH